METGAAAEITIAIATETEIETETKTETEIETETGRRGDHNLGRWVRREHLRPTQTTNSHGHSSHVSQPTSHQPDLVLPLPVPPLSLPLAPFFPLPPLLASRTPPPFASSPFGHTHKRAHPRLPTLGKGAYLAAIHQGLQGHFGGEACTGSSWSCLYRTRAGLLVLSYQYT